MNKPMAITSEAEAWRQRRQRLAEIVDQLAQLVPKEPPEVSMYLRSINDASKHLMRAQSDAINVALFLEARGRGESKKAARKAVFGKRGKEGLN